MKQLFFSLFFLIFSNEITVHAQEGDNNIVIEDKMQEFSFEKSKGDDPVSIAENYTERYRCNDFRTSLVFSEMYNLKENIDKVKIKVNNKSANYIVPRYEYYSVENIFYSDAKVCYFTLPLEKKGSTSEVTVEKTYTDPRYFTSVYFSEPYFLEIKTVKFNIPRWMKVELKEYNFQGYSIKKTTEYNERKEMDVITYTITSLPAAQKEVYSPGGSYFLPHILVLCKQAELSNGNVVFFNTLADQYKWYKQLVAEIGDDNSLLAPKAKELTQGIGNDIDRVKTIFNWVQRNIRYIAFEDGIAGFKPAKAIDVLNKKYGDCKGMANLMKGMLRSIGLDARLCWIGTNHIAYDYSTPSMSVDNHMICAWIYNGKKYFLDATETNIGFNEYAERIQNRQTLIENGDNYLLDNVPSTTPLQNMEKEKSVLSFDGETNLKGSVTQTYKGESRSGLLSSIQNVKKENLQQSLMKYLSEANQDYAINNLKTNDLLGTDSVLNISYDLLHKNGASSFGKEIYVDIDFRKEFDGFLIDTSKRKTDRMLAHKQHEITEVELTVPDGYKVTQLPASATWQHPNASISLSYKQQGNKIFYKKEITIADIWMKKITFLQWNKMIGELSKQYREQIVLAKQ